MTVSHGPDPLSGAALLIDAGRCDDAAAIAYREVTARPGDPRPLLVAAQAELGRRQWAAAEHCAKTAVGLDPSSALGHQILALTRINKTYQTKYFLPGRHPGKEAVAAARTAVSITNGDPRSLAILAETAAVVGQHRLAIRTADALIAKEPTAAASWFVRARVARLVGDLAVGESDVREALRLEPQNYAVNNELGLILRGQGRTSESLRQFKATASLDPSRPHAPHNYLNYGRTLTYIVVAVVLIPIAIAVRVAYLPLLLSAVVNGALWTWEPTKRPLTRWALSWANWRSSHRSRRHRPSLPPGRPIVRFLRVKRLAALATLATAAVCAVVGVVILIASAVGSSPPTNGVDLESVAVVLGVVGLVIRWFARASSRATRDRRTIVFGSTGA